MTTTNIDYITTSFYYPVLTKIKGQPTYNTLKIIKDAIKSNTTTVTTDLGGGTNGHFGLVIIPAKCANISPVLYVKPIQPIALAIPLETTLH